MVVTFGTGMLASLALIVAIGAQNAFVLRQGIRREHVLVVVLICAASDALLILAGTAGVGVVVDRAPVLLDVVRWLGVAFLVGYAVLAARRALRPGALHAAAEHVASRRAVATTAVALTWLNPHVYLDTVVLLGSIANQHGDDGRWVFAAGATASSAIWFALLGAGARAASRWLASPRAWRTIDLLVAATMLVVAALLALG